MLDWAIIAAYFLICRGQHEKSAPSFWEYSTGHPWHRLTNLPVARSLEQWTKKRTMRCPIPFRSERFELKLRNGAFARKIEMQDSRIGPERDLDSHSRIQPDSNDHGSSSYQARRSPTNYQLQGNDPNLGSFPTVACIPQPLLQTNPRSAIPARDRHRCC